MGANENIVDKGNQKRSNNTIFALDIGTRSIIGMVGKLENEKVDVIAIEKAEHTGRAMIDGQIENIDQVADLANSVKCRLEEKTGEKLERVCIAAAGRALKTEKVSFDLELDSVQLITEETISRLEAGAISAAEESFSSSSTEEDIQRRFYLVGYSTIQYYLDNYMMSSLKDHHGKNIKVDIIATFLPGEVVESLYTTMNKIGLEVASVTLEPIAAINAAIPENLRLLNLALADIGAGTSDIAACRDGSVIGYTMATVAGDEITEVIMKEYLVDFHTAEKIKLQLEEQEDIVFTDVLGFEQKIQCEEVIKCIDQASERLCDEIADKIVEINGGSTPSAVFLSGGGSRLKGLREGIIDRLQMSPNRVAIAGNNFQMYAFSEQYELNNPEYATAIGILISSGFNLINDSFQITLNDKPAKLFRSGAFNARDLLMMNGYSYQDLIGKSGKNIILSVNGQRVVFYGTHAEPAVLRINNHDGKLSDIIHAGDSITFIPAVSGSTPKIFIKDLEGAKEAEKIYLNGCFADLFTSVASGDSVEFKNRGEESIGYEHKEIMNDQSEKSDLEKDTNNDLSEKNQRETGAIEPNYNIKTEYSVVREDKNNIENFLEGKEKEEISASSKVQPMEITFMLNGENLTLPRKGKDTPYFLMDILEYSGLDFDNLKNEVVLKVNGLNGYFQQPLKEGDEILIFEKKEQNG
ncbi:MAG: pilus assembly protein PilM [Clostridiales bacterium]|nr:pilus assembly protein PilM [Clostridiales bacterium]